MQALGEAQSQFKIVYDQRIAEFKEQRSIARAAFELEQSVKIEDFYEALRAAIARREHCPYSPIRAMTDILQFDIFDFEIKLTASLASLNNLVRGGIKWLLSNAVHSSVNISIVSHLTSTEKVNNP